MFSSVLPVELQNLEADEAYPGKGALTSDRHREIGGIEDEDAFASPSKSYRFGLLILCESCYQRRVQLMGLSVLSHDENNETEECRLFHPVLLRVSYELEIRR